MTDHGTHEAAWSGVPWSTLMPIVLAIAVAGSLFGATARPLLGPWLTLFSSVVVFSGTVQFTMAGLLAAGTGPFAMLWVVFIVNVRNFALGGAIRPRLSGSMWRRLVTSWFLIDESVGLALTTPNDTDTVLVRTGMAAYVGWVVGTAIGVLAGGALGLGQLAESLFPVLFIGLAALMISGRGALARTLLGAGATLALLAVWPGLGGLAPVLAGVLASIQVRSR